MTIKNKILENKIDFYTIKSVSRYCKLDEVIIIILILKMSQFLCKLVIKSINILIKNKLFGLQYGNVTATKKI